MTQIDKLHDTSFPTATDKDLQMQIRIIREKYGRFFPLVEYQQMNINNVQEHTNDTPDDDTPTYETEIDDLWGEPIPNGQLQGDKWINPHTTETLDATKCNKRVNRGKINVQIDHQPSERSLIKWGIDEKRVITCKFFVPLLEDNGIVVAMGDRFYWKNHTMEIRNWKRTGYWKNTSHHLYIEAVATYARYGS